MWLQSSKPNGGAGHKAPAPATRGLVAIAIDKDKGSQSALKWTTENLVSRGQTLVLIHVLHKSFHGSATAGQDRKQQIEKQTKELFGVFHVFCTRKDIQTMDIILEDADVSKALMQYVYGAAIENLVLGASKHGFLKRLNVMDVPTCVSKGAPDFCTVYVISKAKISSVRNASRPAPFMSPLYNQINKKNEEQQDNSPATAPAAVVPKVNAAATPAVTHHKHTPTLKDKLATFGEKNNRASFMYNSDMEIPFRSPFDKAAGRGIQGKSFSDFPNNDTDISFVSSGRPSTDTSSMFYDGLDSGRTSRVSTSLGSGFRSKASDTSSFTDFSTSSVDSDEGDSEMKRLGQELRKMMDLYNTTCKEALTAKQKAIELQLWRIEEEKQLEEAQVEDDVSKVSSESGKRSGSEAEEVENGRYEFRYKRYTIEEIEEATERFSESRKIGEGGYGPVFKCILDHTPVAVKVLRPDVAQGMSQFHKEVIDYISIASRPAPFMSPLYNQINKKNEEQQDNSPPTATAPVVPKVNAAATPAVTRHKHTPTLKDKLATFGEKNNRASFMYNSDMEIPFRSPFDKASGRGIEGKPFSDFPDNDTDISFVSSGRPSTDTSSMFYDGLHSGRTSRVSTNSESSLGSGFGLKASDTSSFTDFSTSSVDSDEGDAEMKRLKQELQKMMDLYSTACKEALTAKKKATEFQLWRIEEEKRLEEAQLEDDVSKVSSGSGKRSGSEAEELENGRYEFRHKRYTIEEIEEANERFSESRKIGE